MVTIWLPSSIVLFDGGIGCACGVNRPKDVVVFVSRLEFDCTEVTVVLELEWLDSTAMEVTCVSSSASSLLIKGVISLSCEV